VTAAKRFFSLALVTVGLGAGCRSVSGPDTSQVAIRALNVVSAGASSGRNISFDLEITNQSRESIYALACAMRLTKGSGSDARVIATSLCGDEAASTALVAYSTMVFHYAIIVAEADVDPNARYAASIVISFESGGSSGVPISSGPFVIP
jgi:hypothetical protein